MTRTRKPIYGCKNPTQCDPSPPPTLLLTLLRNIVNKISSTVADFFPAGKVNAPFTAEMTVKAYIPPGMLARFLWKRTYRGVAFDVNNMIHLNQLKDFYYQVGGDWTQDPVFPKRATGRRRRGQLV
jgi:hypothetical protein